MKTTQVFRFMKVLAAIVCITTFFSLNHADTGKISGVITEHATTQPIANVTIHVMQNSREIMKTTSNSHGAFSVQVPVGSYTLLFKAKGYEEVSLACFVQKDKTVLLSPQLPVEVSVSPIENIDIAEESMEYELAAPMQVGYAQKMGYAQNIVIRGQGTVLNNYAAESPLYQTEDYDKIDENGIKDAAKSPFSTFSIDVDRAAYANVRRFILQQNMKPNVDAVRIEEMINYFDYTYPQPHDEHPFSVTIEGTDCPWNSENKLVLIGLQGENIAEKDVPASNLVFLIDVSGSMQGPQRLGLVKQAFGELITKLRPEDRVSIVVYSGAAGVVLEPTAGNQKEIISAAIDRLEAGGSTAGAQGIQKAYELAKKTYIHGGNNRVILASDGDFNVGIQSNAELVRYIEEQRKEGVYLTILGFGMGNYKDNRFEQLSNAGNGNYAYIDNLNEAKKIFGKELWGTLYTIADDVKIQVEFNPAIVQSYRLIGYENRMLATEDFENDKKDAGEVGAGHSVTALYEVTLVNKARKGTDSQYIQQTYTNSNDMLSVHVRYKQPHQDTSILLTKSLQLSNMRASSNIMFASCVAQFGMLLRNSEFKGESNFSQVLATAKEYVGKDEFGYKKEFMQLVEKAQHL